MKAYTIGAADFMGRSRVALRERNGRGETIGHVQQYETGWVATASDFPVALPGSFGTRAAAAAALFEATCELIEGDEGSVATCDLCGEAGDHEHAADEYGPVPGFCDHCGMRLPDEGLCGCDVEQTREDDEYCAAMAAELEENR